MSLTQNYKTIKLSPETVSVLLLALSVRISTIEDIMLQFGTSLKSDSDAEVMRQYWAGELDSAKLAVAEFRAQLERAA